MLLCFVAGCVAGLLLAAFSRFVICAWVVGFWASAVLCLLGCLVVMFGLCCVVWNALEV